MGGFCKTGHAVEKAVIRNHMKTQTKETLASRIAAMATKLPMYFNSAAIIKYLKAAHRKLVINRGAVNAAIDTLVRKGWAEVIRQGAGRRETVWKLNAA